jgi:hypothetical protein
LFLPLSSSSLHASYSTYSFPLFLVRLFISYAVPLKATRKANIGTARSCSSNYDLCHKEHSFLLSSSTEIARYMSVTTWRHDFATPYSHRSTWSPATSRSDFTHNRCGREVAESSRRTNTAISRAAELPQACASTLMWP